MKMKRHDDVRWYDLTFAAVVLAIAVYAAASSADPVAGTLNFNISQAPATNGQVVPSLSWSTDPNANRCVASGDWTGSKAVDRTSPAVLAAVTPPKTYILTCYWDDTDASLTWVAPTQNKDGSPLTDLAGYVIYYGGAPSTLDRNIQITDPSLTQRLVTGLAIGNWYFRMTAKNSAGLESDPSATVNIALTSANNSVTRTVEAKIPLPPGGLTATP